jgi:hypothetical protein
MLAEGDEGDRCLYKFKERVSRDFASDFYHKSVSHQPLSILLRPFQIFSKIHRDIRKSRCTNDTGGKIAIASIVDTGGKFATGVNGTSGKQWE